MVTKVWDYNFRQPVIEINNPIERARISGASVNSDVQRALGTGVARANLAYAALANSDNHYGVEALPQEQGELVIGRDVIDIAHGKVTHTYGIRQLRVVSPGESIEPDVRDMREEQILRATLGYLINRPVTRPTFFFKKSLDFHVLDLEIAQTPRDAHALANHF